VDIGLRDWPDGPEEEVARDNCERCGHPTEFFMDGDGKEWWYTDENGTPVNMCDECREETGKDCFEDD
jgi:hypothetical protein